MPPPRLSHTHTETERGRETEHTCRWSCRPHGALCLSPSCMCGARDRAHAIRAQHAARATKNDCDTARSLFRPYTHQNHMQFFIQFLHISRGFRLVRPLVLALFCWKIPGGLTICAIRVLHDAVLTPSFTMCYPYLEGCYISQ